MSDPLEQAPNDQSPEPGNDDQFAAANDALGVAPSDTGETEQPAGGEADPLDEQRERSRLGRRLTRSEQEISELRSVIQSLQYQLQPRPAPVDNDQPPVDYISTPEDLEAYEAWRAEKREKRRTAYANQYVGAVKSLQSVNPEMHAEVERELLTNVSEYPTYSDFKNPADDAYRNYLKAENKLLKSKVAGVAPRPNVRGGANTPPGVSAMSRVNAPPRKTVKLDEYASKFLKSIGESEDSEWVQNTLSRTE